MEDSSQGDVAQLLRAAQSGNRGAVEQLLPIVYAEMRRLASAYLREERSGHTLQPTALVHEAFIKLVGQESPGWRDAGQFFGVAAQAMRRILVDHARTKKAAKRGGGRSATPLDETVNLLEERALDLVALDEALTELRDLDERKGRVVELRFFAGLTIEDTAQALGVTTRTVERDWTLAKAWLRGRVTRGVTDDA